MSQSQVIPELEEVAESRLMRISTYASLTVALTLVAAKISAWLFTDSLSLLSSLIDSVMDALASAVTLVAVRHALRPADREHRFGHGKVEALAGLSQAAFIAGSAVFLCFESVERFINPSAVTRGGLGIAVMLFSIVLTLGLVAFQSQVVRRTGSLAISADKLHYVGDLLINAGVILSLVLSSYLNWTWADPLFGFAIALFILKSAWEIAKGALDMLMDRELPEEERDNILEIVRSFGNEVKGVHDLRTRASGIQTFIQFHLELDGKQPLLRAHEISDRVMKKVMEAYPNAEVLVHQDPAEIDEDIPFFPSKT